MLTVVLPCFCVCDFLGDDLYVFIFIICSFLDYVILSTNKQMNTLVIHQWIIKQILQVIQYITFSCLATFLADDPKTSSHVFENRAHAQRIVFKAYAHLIHVGLVPPLAKIMLIKIILIIRKKNVCVSGSINSIFKISYILWLVCKKYWCYVCPLSFQYVG